MGKYRVEAILGQGGMGVVAECTHLALNERVAIKLLRQDVMLDQDAVSRFVREAQAAVKLKSEYVARVSDVGAFENGTPYMVMEYLEGHDLGELLKQRGVLPVQWAVELMLQTAEALCEAHSLGIVHRDVKPTNLFVTWRPDGTSLIKVLDFGISKSPMGTDMQLTQTQSLLGTPAYMSPEQMRSARLVDHRTDIWSLGTVFYEVLEGRKPFEAASFSEMCVKVAVDDPDSMHNAPPPLQQVIMRCLAKTPDQRYANMGEFARDLIPFSADPHAAQMLVERMARMLKRSTFDWEGNSTGVSRQALPAGRELDSGPVRTPIPGTPIPRTSSQWGMGSDPAARPWRAGSEPGLQRNTPIPTAVPTIDNLGSAAHAVPTLNEPKRSRAMLWIVLVGVLVGIGGTIFYVTQAQNRSSLANETKDDGDHAVDPAAGNVEPAVTTGNTATPSPDPTKPDLAKPESGQDPAAVDAAKPGAGSAAAMASKTHALTGGAGSASDVKPKATGTKTQTKTGSKITKASGGSKTTTVKTATKTEPRVIKAGSGSAAPEEKKPPDKPPCDVFNSRTGCK
jgi:eukaryotic-like serine/threonine-protein kinase